MRPTDGKRLCWSCRSTADVSERMDEGCHGENFQRKLRVTEKANLGDETKSTGFSDWKLMGKKQKKMWQRNL